MAQQKPVYNADGTHVFVMHPDVGMEWECPVAYLPVAQARGYQLIQPRDRSLDGLFDDATAEGPNQTGFDPGQHTVDEINAYLAEHAEGAPGEVARVLELERAGKNRVTVVDPRPAVTDEGDQQDPAGSEPAGSNPGE